MKQFDKQYLYNFTFTYPLMGYFSALNVLIIPGEYLGT
ncbi:hypothetical protein BH09BAC2_BH09BAC2_10360 [soil metagenome]